MEILLILVSLLVIAIALYWAWTVFIILGHIFIATWPVILGILICIFLWTSGQDNIGILFALAGIALNFWWVKFFKSRFGRNPFYYSSSSSDYDPMSGKVARYDKNGNLIGYKDRE